MEYFARVANLAEVELIFERNMFKPEILIASNKLQKEWQARWREALGASTDSMPDDVGCDFEIQFNLWELDENKLSSCFELFPNGEKMLERAVEIRSIKIDRGSFEDKDLLITLESIIDRTGMVVEQTTNESAIKLAKEMKNSKNRMVYSGDNNYLIDTCSSARDVTDPIGEILQNLFVEHHAELGLATFNFLSEPFYRIGDDYVVRDAVLWPAIEEHYSVNPFDPAMELYSMGARAGWDSENDEVFVFVER